MGDKQIGSEHEPYHVLNFIDVPDEIMPETIADTISSMTRLINSLMRKQACGNTEPEKDCE